MPIISESDRTEYMYITIKNIGDGFIDDLTNNNIVILQPSDNVVVDDSKIPTKIHPIDNVFPKIALPLHLHSNIDYLKNYEITLQINYVYHLRDKISINIIR